MNLLIFSTTFLAVFGTTYGLSCYECRYHEGFPDNVFPEPSDPDCELDPQNLVSCGTSLSDFHVMARVNSSSSETDQLKQLKWACGREKVEVGDTMRYVYRGCTQVADTQEDNCDKYTEIIDQVSSTVEVCFCFEEGCNSASFEDPSTDPTTPNQGGSGQAIFKSSLTLVTSFITLTLTVCALFSQ